MEYYSVVFCFLTILSGVQLDQILFPGDSQIASPNTNMRVPLSGSTKCPNNKYLYYPGDQESDWICDCKPAYVYYPQRDDCYPVYRKGPCNADQYLILPAGKAVPECVPNPCKKDREVLFNYKCEKLFTTSPCQTDTEKLKSSVLEVNETTLELQCIARSSVELTLITAPGIPCPPGSKRRINGHCTVVIN